MTTFTRKTTLTLAAVALMVAAASNASAGHPQALLVGPPNHNLPKFGFYSFNIAGFGERVTSVRWGSLAHQLGLESGDTILEMNDFGLTYRGAWNDALRMAIANGGWVQLTILDVRTNHIAYRTAFVGPGPVAHHVVAYGGATSYLNDYCYPNEEHFGHPHGPITLKSVQGPQGPGGNKKSVNNTLHNIQALVQAFKDKD